MLDQSTCSIPECPDQATIKGLCRRHYNTAWKREQRARYTPDEHARYCIRHRASYQRHRDDRLAYAKVTHQRQMALRAPVAYVDLPGEEWRAAVGYEGFYEVSSEGRVRRSKNAQRILLLRPLALRAGSRGYLTVNLCVGGKRRNTLVHQLIARAFIGERPSGWTVNHEDGVKANNRPANLTYMTVAGNVQHAYRTGLAKGQPGEANGMARLTSAQVHEIRALKGTGPAASVAPRYAVSIQTIYDVWNGRKWKHVR